jgi:hypothetical protein
LAREVSFKNSQTSITEHYFFEHTLCLSRRIPVFAPLRRRSQSESVDPRLEMFLTEYTLMNLP